MDTLIVDFDGVYHPRLMNDRLLLGLKGTMSEFELGLIRQRAHEALRQMVQRGELYTTLPIGYVRSEDGRCEQDPDLRIQHAVQSVFEKFAERGSARQVLLWFRGEGIPLPAVAYGAHGREVVWKLPRYGTIHKFLANPIYAGAYAFGRTETRTRLVGEHPVIRAGIFTETTKALLQETEHRIASLRIRLSLLEEPAVRSLQVLPSVVERYLGELASVLHRDTDRSRQILSALVAEVTVRPPDGGLVAETGGNVSGLLGLSDGNSGAGRGIPDLASWPAVSFVA
jgi:hypothetical protein